MAIREEDVWDQVVERIELDATDADLAAAERALREVEAEEVRVELIDAVVARARGEVVAEAAAAAEVAPVPVRAMPRMRRIAAAAAAMLWGSKVSAATTATVTVATVVAVMALWGGRFSREMTYQVAIQILIRGDQSAEYEAAALREVFERVYSAVENLQKVRDDTETPNALVDIAKLGLAELQSRAISSLPPIPSSLDGTLDIDVAVSNALDKHRSEAERGFFLQTTTILAANGLSSMHRVNRLNDSLQVARADYFNWLRSLLSK